MIQTPFVNEPKKLDMKVYNPSNSMYPHAILGAHSGPKTKETLGEQNLPRIPAEPRLPTGISVSQSCEAMIV